MELPSMVQRSGDTLIVRSVVSGNQIYHGINPNKNITNKIPKGKSSNETTTQFELHLNGQTASVPTAQNDDRIDKATEQIVVGMNAYEGKDECLPQCKIKRNYSCSYCTYFTQNPRCHLTHLRDVHGEKIVINKCKLCLYASRHFQKLVRHMKMVHGCTDGITSEQGHARGKRGISRAARKLKLEQSIGLDRGRRLDSEKCDDKEMKNYVDDNQRLELNQLNSENNNVLVQKPDNHLTNKFNFIQHYDTFQEKSSNDLRRSNEYDTVQPMLTAKSELPGADFSIESYQSITNKNQLERSIINSNKNDDKASVVSSNRNISTLYDESVPSSIDIQERSPSLQSSSEYSPTRLLKCSVCDFTTPYRDGLVGHETEEHCRTKFYRCEKCSYVTHIKTRFSKHVKYHSMPMIKCVICDFKTPYKWNLDRHMKNHGGAGPFKCAACDFTADIKQSLTVHEMNHHVPPVGHLAGMSFARRRNKVGGTDMMEDFFSDSMDMMYDEQFNSNKITDNNDKNNNVTNSAASNSDNYREELYFTDNDDKPTDLSQKLTSKNSFQEFATANSSDQTAKARKPLPNLIPLPNVEPKDLMDSQYSLSKIASLFFNERQLSEMMKQLKNPQSEQNFPSTMNSSNTSHGFTKKRASQSSSSTVFDKLKSSAFMMGAGGPNENLVCSCGHLAKCLSEAIIHRKSCSCANADNTHDDDNNDDDDEDEGDDRLEIDFRDDDGGLPSHSSTNNIFVTNSNRCQHCRQRCKTSIDLANHLKSCSEAKRYNNETLKYMSVNNKPRNDYTAEDVIQESFHPMENRIFIWNNMNNNNNKDNRIDNNDSLMDTKRFRSEQSCNVDVGKISGEATTNMSPTMHSVTLSKNEEDSYYGVETAPGYGEVTKKMTPEEEAANSSLKKVYKCPHCSFWASTASRFHVHIVGHLNKKPFECSLCSYRSNWRWDITKHIRLKTIRDPSHKTARVLMNDETGRRNYTKYNKYITLMKVTEEDGDPKLMKSGEMTPNQVASLAFLNDFKKGTPQSNDLNQYSDHSAKRLNDTLKDTVRDTFIHLPLLATMMNAAMTQQQQQQQQQQQHQPPLKHRLLDQSQQQTLITPSVTISPIKRLPSHHLKDGNESFVFEGGLYKCSQCTYRHSNRDVIKSHVFSSHYKDIDGIPSERNMASITSNCDSSNYVEAISLKRRQDDLNENTDISGSTKNQHDLKQSISFPMNALRSKMPTDVRRKTGISKEDIATDNNNKSSAGVILEHGEQKSNEIEASAQPLPSASLQLKQNILGNGDGNTCIRDNLKKQHASSLLQQKQINFELNSDVSVAVHPHTSNLIHSSSNFTSRNSLMSGGVGFLGDLTSLSPSTTARFVTDQLSSAATTKFNAPGSIVSASNKAVLTEGKTTTTTTTTISEFSSASVLKSSSIRSVADYSANPSVSALFISNSSSSTLSPSPSPSPLQLRRNNTDHIRGEHNKSINKQLSHPTSNSRGDDRSEPSPYRCGHCHQLSNWKHVIQRHCRLKHDGDVLIETLDRSTLTKHQIESPKYRTLGIASIPGESNCDRATLAFNARKSKDSETTSAGILKYANLKSLQEDSTKIDSIGSQSFHLSKTRNYPSQTSHITMGRLGVGLDDSISETAIQNNSTWNILNADYMNMHADNEGGGSRQSSKCRQQMCPFCPYISESKSQMNYHISLHRPTQYECSLCTFICAKKQHLSSHLRTVHNQNNYKYNSLTMSNMSKQFRLNGQQITSSLDTDEGYDGKMLHHQKSIANANEIEIVSYCPKCPAHFIGKLNDARNALSEHLKGHSQPNAAAIKCGFCDFQMANITIGQNHRYVHSESHIAKYLDPEFRKLKTDEEHPPPKYKKFTNFDHHNCAWVVHDETLTSSDYQRLVDYLVPSGSQSINRNSNSSLLKKHLESEPVQCDQIEDNSHSPSSHSLKRCRYSSPEPPIPSTSPPQQQPLHKCSNCPLETNDSLQFTEHLQHHISISNRSEKFTCEHCDFTATDEQQIMEHNMLHFNCSEKLKSIKLFTSYDALELCIESDSNNAIEDQKDDHKNMNMNIDMNEQNDKYSKENIINEICDSNTIATIASTVSTKILESDKLNFRDKNNSSNSYQLRSDNNNSSGTAAVIINNNNNNNNKNYNYNKNNNNNNTISIIADAACKEMQTPSNKTILVNAKTGQVIERNTKETLQ